MNKILKHLGLDFVKFIRFIIRFPKFYRTYLKFRKMEGATKFGLLTLRPFLFDQDDQSGNTQSHYFYQDLHVAQRIFVNSPVKHVDFGSRIDGFVAHVASYRELEVFDLRNLESSINNVQFKQMDLTRFDNTYLDYADSVSCLHTIEHIGLGRYGDQIDINGHLKAIVNLAKVLKKNGRIYISAPIGRQRIEFNGQRVFDVEYLHGQLSKYFDLIQFSFINDQGEFFAEFNLAKLSGIEIHYGCGIFEMKKK